MVHTLKRIYLYTATTFALLVSAGVTVNLLDLFLQALGLQRRYLPYDGGATQYSPLPTTQAVEQGLLLFIIVALLVGLLFGGGHCLLIRRDAHSDPGADGGSTRHLFLNGLMALSILIVVPAALNALSDVDAAVGEIDPAISLSFLLVFGLLFGLVLWERARVPPASRGARIIRQLQENGGQAILVIIASAVISSGISTVIGWILVKNHAAQPNCVPVATNTPASFTPSTFCTTPPALSSLLQIVLMLAVWRLYARLGAWSRGLVLQRILWYAASGYGVIWLLIGVAMGIYTGAAVLFGVPNAWRDALNAFLPFVGVFITGLLIATPYFLWLRRLAVQMPDRRQAIQQGLLAIPAALSAGFLLAGVILLLQGAVEQAVPSSSPVGAAGWATAVGALVAGLGYPALWRGLRRASNPATPGPIIPRRAYVLVILAATAIGAIIAAVITAYQIAAVFLSLPFADALMARRAAVVLLVLGAMALYHLWQLRADQRATHARTVAEQAAPPVEAGGKTPETLESILSAVAAGRLDPTTAAARIRSLPDLERSRPSSD